MKHLGDITKIDTSVIDIPDCITGGSPCQDLSVAGKRAGLDGERSGLFMEQIRIVKELRERDRRENHRAGEYVRPRYMVWENVPGAFSSGTPKGADFQVVLTEIARIAKADAPDVPLPDKWGKSGCLMGIGTDGCPFSIAWRLHDAQFWGVAQRRKRIALVADFGGGSAPEILFEREGLHGDSDQSGKAWEETSGDSGLGAEESGQIDEFIAAANKDVPHQQDLIQSDQGVARSLAASTHGAASHLTKTLITKDLDPRAYTLKVRGGVEVDSNGRKAGKGALIQTELSGTLGVSQDQTLICLDNQKTDTAFCVQGGGVTSQNSQGLGVNKDISFTINAVDRHAVASFGFEPGAAKRLDPENRFTEDCSPTLRAEMGDNQVAVVIMSNASAKQLPRVYDASRRHAYEQFGEVSETVQAAYGTGGNNQPLVVQGKAVFEQHSQDSRYNPMGETCETVSAKYGTGGNNQPIVIEPIPIDGNRTRGSHQGMGEYKQIVDEGKCISQGSVVRRLTPMECERLQGFPDGWTDIGEWIDSKGKLHKESSDAARYKALGNSIAVGYANNASGFWCYLLKRISAQYERNATLGSLFDGIGGFPLAWEHYNGKGSAIWASEIEEFCIAVTKKRFPEA